MYAHATYKKNNQVMVMAKRLKNVWPKKFAGEIVFLLDVETGMEKQLLEDYIREHCPVPDARIVHLSLRSGKTPAQNGHAIKKILAEDKQQYFIPLRVTWWSNPLAKENIAASLVDAIPWFGWTPGLVRQKLQLKNYLKKKNASPYEIVVAKGASQDEIDKRFKSKPRDVDLPRYIAKLALLALERTERGIKGARYKIPRMIDEEVLGRPQLKEALEEISQSSKKGFDEIREEAAACLKEMAATPTPEGLDLVAALGRFMYTRGFDEQLDFLKEDIDRVHELLADRPMAFVFTHKSHVDGFLLYTFFHDMNLPPVHTFGGINMGFMGLGAMLRKAGAILIRRTFGSDEVYKAVFKNYIDYLGEKRFPLMWSLEGTRSRTGKLMPPRFGLINYVISSYLREDDTDLVIMPISIVYDQIPEVYDYDDLQAGGDKRPESAFWFMQYLKGLKNPHGKIHIRFGKGIKVSDYVHSASPCPTMERWEMQKLGFDLAVDVNNVTPITVNSLICFVLLEQGHRAISISQFTNEINRLLAFVAIYQFPMTEEAKNITPEILQKFLDQLAATGVINITEEGIDVLYMIPYGGARIAAYYRNGLIQFFITGAIGELALMAVKSSGDGAIEEFRQEALRIRDLMKYEFFFEGSEQFLTLLEGQFDKRIKDWREMVMDGREAIRKMLPTMDILIGHGTLRPFIEAYLVFARALIMVPEEGEVDINALIKQSLALGKQGVLQQRIHCEESVSQNYFENAVKIARGKNLLGVGSPVKEERQALYNELLELRANTRILASISDARRYEKALSLAVQGHI